MHRVILCYLIFADDCFVFSRGDLALLLTIWKYFEQFSGMSRLYASGEKSEIYFGGVDSPVQDSILKAIEYRTGIFPFRYLGLPLSTKRLSHYLC